METRLVSPFLREIYPDPNMKTMSAFCWICPKFLGMRAVPHRLVVRDLVGRPGPAVEAGEPDLVGLIEIGQLEVQLAGVERVQGAVRSLDARRRDAVSLSRIVRVGDPVDTGVVVDGVPVAVIVDAVVLAFVNEEVAVVVDAVVGDCPGSRGICTPYSPAAGRAPPSCRDPRSRPCSGSRRALGRSRPWNRTAE